MRFISFESIKCLSILFNLNAPKMKRVFSILLLALTSMIFAQEKVGESRNGTFVITASLDVLKPAWQKWLGEQRISDPLTRYEIEEQRAEDGSTYYLLVASTKSGIVKVATGLDRVGNDFFAASESGNFASRVVSCSNCAIGCHPKYLKRDRTWICTPECADGCKKTETIRTKTLSFQ